MPRMHVQRCSPCTAKDRAGGRFMDAWPAGCVFLFCRWGAARRLPPECSRMFFVSVPLDSHHARRRAVAACIMGIAETAPASAIAWWQRSVGATVSNVRRAAGPGSDGNCV